MCVYHALGRPFRSVERIGVGIRSHQPIERGLRKIKNAQPQEVDEAVPLVRSNYHVYRRSMTIIGGYFSLKPWYWDHPSNILK